MQNERPLRTSRSESPPILDDPEIIENAPRKPVIEYGLELQGSCNFGCENCYMYQGDNAHFRRMRRPMSLEVVEKLADRMMRHAAEYNDNPNSEYSVDNMYVVLHGGEPLLDVPHLIDAVRILRSHFGDGDPRLHIRVQTNGSLLTQEVIEQLVAPDIDVMIGVSVDGMAEDHDRARPLLSGRPSFEKVAANIDTLVRIAPGHFHKLLVTLGPHNMRPPSESDHELYGCATNAVPTFRSLERFIPDPSDNDQFEINFILPHASWDNPPPDWDPTGDSTLYADYMIELFDYLWTNNVFQIVKVPFFHSILEGIARLEGLWDAAAQGEVFGLGDTSYFFIEPDGEIRGSDALKTISSHADEIRLLEEVANVFRNDFSELLNHRLIALRQMGKRALVGDGSHGNCIQCDLVEICGGGRFTDRQKGGDFRNPSVYCHELKLIIRHILDEFNQIMARFG